MRLKFDETSMTSERGKVRTVKREGVTHASLDPLGLNHHYGNSHIVNPGFDRWTIIVITISRVDAIYWLECCYLLFIDAIYLH